jgi:hypothetical protein
MQEDPMWLTRNQKKILPFDRNTNSNSKRELKRFENPSHAEFWAFVSSMSDFKDNSRIAHNLAWDGKSQAQPPDFTHICNWVTFEVIQSLARILNLWSLVHPQYSVTAQSECTQFARFHFKLDLIWWNIWASSEGTVQAIPNVGLKIMWGGPI